MCVSVGVQPLSIKMLSFEVVAHICITLEHDYSHNIIGRVLDLLCFVSSCLITKIYSKYLQHFLKVLCATAFIDREMFLSKQGI